MREHWRGGWIKFMEEPETGVIELCQAENKMRFEKRMEVGGAVGGDEQRKRIYDLGWCVRRKWLAMLDQTSR